MKKITIRDVLEFYEQTLKKTVKNKNKLINLEMHKSEHLKYIVDVLNGIEPLIHKYNIFLIYEPKPRLIMSLSINDKIINHYYTTNYLIPKLEKKLDDRNVATRIGKGTDYAINLVKKYIEFYKRKNKIFYVLKIDISKYFYRIDHDILKAMLKTDLSDCEYNFVCKIIDSTNYDYINSNIKKILKNNKNLKVPLYEYGKGLPIGNLSSQCLSIYYLSRLDHYIIHTLKLKHYVRYMDDFLIFSDDLLYLKKCKEIIINKLNNEYKLDISINKTFITSSKYGFTFLGYKFFIQNKKTIMIVKRSSVKNMKKNVKKKIYLYKNEKLKFETYFSSMMNYYYSYRCNKKKIEKIIDSYL
ncbi:MAG: hypothetical protein IJ134_02950 [Bacilli bacterium]|nr:hypothetical protein [Bacilli bacterium]